MVFLITSMEASTWSCIKLRGHVQTLWEYHRSHWWGIQETSKPNEADSESNINIEVVNNIDAFALRLNTFSKQEYWIYLGSHLQFCEFKWYYPRLYASKWSQKELDIPGFSSLLLVIWNNLKVLSLLMCIWTVSEGKSVDYTWVLPSAFASGDSENLQGRAPLSIKWPVQHRLVFFQVFYLDWPLYTGILCSGKRDGTGIKWPVQHRLSCFQRFYLD